MTQPHRAARRGHDKGGTGPLCRWCTHGSSPAADRQRRARVCTIGRPLAACSGGYGRGRVGRTVQYPAFMLSCVPPTRPSQVRLMARHTRPIVSSSPASALPLLAFFFLYLVMKGRRRRWQPCRLRPRRLIAREHARARARNGRRGRRGVVWWPCSGVGRSAHGWRTHGQHDRGTVSAQRRHSVGTLPAQCQHAASTLPAHAAYMETTTTPAMIRPTWRYLVWQGRAVLQSPRRPRRLFVHARHTPRTRRSMPGQPRPHFQARARAPGPTAGRESRRRVGVAGARLLTCGPSSSCPQGRWHQP